MDYSELSDGEINKLVAKYFPNRFSLTEDGEPCDLIPDAMAAYSGSDYDEVIFDPCNNPSSAWPIIAENRISIFFDETDPEYEGTPYQWCSAISTCQKYHVQYLSNPLRAAMIVFLMIQDSK